MQLNIMDIMKLLPQRFPMLLVDVVTELEPLSLARGVKAVSYNEPYFQGHFPGRPVMPGVLIIEALGQLIYIMIASQDEYAGKMVYYTKISKAKFWDPVFPGSMLELMVSKKAQQEEFMVCNAVASVAGKDVFSAEITMMITD